MWRVVAVLWACFVVRGAFYCALLPLWEGWDEWSHFAYLQFLVNTGEPPHPGTSFPSREIVESLRIGPIAPTLQEFAPNAPTHDVYWQLPPAERETSRRRLLTFPHEWRNERSPSAGPIYEAQQPPLYYWLLAGPFLIMSGAPLLVRVFVIRLISILLASTSVPLGFLLLQRALSSNSLAFASLSLVCVMPVFAINVARVGNEAPAVVIHTLLLLLIFRLFEGRVDRWWGVQAGVVLACGLLTKAYFLTAIPAVTLVCAWAVWDHKLTFQIAAKHLAIALAIAAACSGWWYLYIRAATGTFSGQIQAAAAREASFVDRLRTITHVNWLQAIDTHIMSHVWFGAASFLRVRSWMYHFFGFVLALAVVGLVVLLVSRRRTDIEQWWARVSVPVLGCFLLCFLASLAYHVVVTYLLIHQSMTNGWYLYALVFAEVGVIAIGLMSLMPADLRRWVLPAGTACFAVLDLYGTNFLLAPYYLGLIHHTDTGRLQAFHLSMLGGVGWNELVARFGWNRPFLGRPETFVVLWLLYLAATIVPLIIAFHAATHRADSCAPR